MFVSCSVGSSALLPPPETAPQLPDIWSLLETRPRVTSPETRTLPCSHRAGVKLRCGKRLEVKLLRERHENGAESWFKVG